MWILLVALWMQARPGVPRPQFAASQIGLASGGSGGWLWPGDTHSIYGKNLGPGQSCTRDAEKPLPTELCGVRVLIDEEPVPLIYVHERQINFVAPRSGSSGGKVTLRVVHGGFSSVPVSLKFGPDRIGISQPEVAYTGMPVWVRVLNVSDTNRPVELALTLRRIWLVNCPHIEVMFKDVPLPELKTKNMPRRIAYSGPPCRSPLTPDRRSLVGRVPLHLQYRFDRPGIYMVRYVPPEKLFGHRSTASASQWTPIQVKAGTGEQRRKWIQARAAAAPCDPETLVYDFLPSIFGFGDTAALTIALKYLYHPDATVSGVTAAYLRDYYTASELLPALDRILRQKGANPRVSELRSSLAN
jgi:hypothetical protein